MAYDSASLDKPLEALKAFDWGGDAAPLQAIDAAVIAVHADLAARANLEKRLAGLLGAGTSQPVTEYVCRKLSMIGTAASVPTLAALLPKKDHSHMARFASSGSPRRRRPRPCGRRSPPCREISRSA